MTESKSPLKSSRAEGAPAGNTIVSLLVFVHLFFVFVALSGTYARSGLTATLLRRFAFYTRLLNLAPESTSFYLTHGTDADVDHRVEVMVRSNEQWSVFPGAGLRGTDSRQRYQRFAAEWAAQSLEDGDPARFAQATASHFARQRQQTPVQVRCRKHYQLSREDYATDQAADRDPDAPDRFSVPYAANVIISPSGLVDIIRIEDAGQVAAPVSSRRTASGDSDP